MQFAINKHNQERMHPHPKGKGSCPVCSEEVIAKCGSVNVWHWAHKTSTDCPGAKLETYWHRQMKEKFPEDQREAIVRNHLGTVIADAYDKETNTMYEFDFKNQLTTEEINKKNDIYRASGYKVIWVFHVDDSITDRIGSTKNPRVRWFKYGLRRLLGLDTPFILTFKEEFMIPSIIRVDKYWQFEENNRIYLKGKYLNDITD